MLSPHEIAALILLDNANDPQQLNPADLDVLLHQQLVQPDPNVCAQGQLHLTNRGRQVLELIARTR